MPGHTQAERDKRGGFAPRPLPNSKKKRKRKLRRNPRDAARGRPI